MIDHIIIYSHGFGVEKDDRGLFTDISQSLPNTKHVMFNYNKINKINNTIIVDSLLKQSKKLEEVYRKIRNENSHSVIDLICHSQGCVVVANTNLLGIRKTIFLAPPDNLNLEGIQDKYNRPGTIIDMDRESRITRKDGSITIVSKEYWESIKNLNILKLYNSFSNNTDLTIIKVREDEILGTTDFSNLKRQVKIKELKADHNFKGESREQVKIIIKNILIKYVTS